MNSKELYYKFLLNDETVDLVKSSNFEELTQDDCAEDVFISMIVEQRAKKLGKEVGEYLDVVAEVLKAPVKSR